jgi:NADPH:quinone reductase
MPPAIQIQQTGGPEALNWTGVDVGEPASGQVGLHQAAAGLNYIDVYSGTGYHPQPLPIIPGLEDAGTVEAVASDVRGLKVGDRAAFAGPVNRRFALKDAANAHRALESRATAGSTILTIYPSIHGSL